MSMGLYTDIQLNGFKVTGGSDPSAATDYVTLQYLQAFQRGLRWKEPVRAASTGNVNVASPGTTLDGVTLVAQDRVLLKNQTTGSENGVYIWTASGSALTRALDFDAAAEVIGAAVTAMEGTTNANTVYTQNVEPVTIGTTTMTFVVVGGSGTTYTAGAGLTLTTTVFAIDTAVVVRKYAVDFGNASLTTFTITHNLGTLDAQVQIVLNSTGETVWCQMVRATTNTLTISGFSTAPTSNQFRCLVQA